ncbi:glycogen synthase kinase-3 beta [Pyrenophora tritici-repentis]|uniref:Uncharacterized protein n=1 Tax=Pyrenophora tritici-repentis TaxID=45151 RepID=A0A2W1ETT9_9PLEO|nr:hypothetical protein PtrM4_016390 [Pyrenophora tritici-repentis]KAI0584863.1 glycogen synthase kinase-3 beta [Pyrenophora tritici-repentis]KAI0591941.1 hypothetical protein Alg130_00822 [Pyrenophora tritici-repentis]KAI0614713.1 glycogen synthase kinase-3 beta [Pyrenophora tritici-repentis]KAI0626619.1 glycogen synthase kinase-3 beta [Pyrenophora tritici-repentis]
MTQNRPSAFSSLRMGEVIREKVQDGLTGDYKDLAYTQCKIVGNGSFGVVFQTKLSPSGEDAAIKRVLQDKRFKVRVAPPLACNRPHIADLNRTANSKSCALSAIPTLSNSRPSSTTTASGYVSASKRMCAVHVANRFSHRRTRST